MTSRLFWASGVFLFIVLAISVPALAHGVHSHDQEFITSAAGAHPFSFMYLGAKHMVTGYDHLAYLAGVIFFLSKVKDVFKFVSLFAVGHSITLLLGVMAGIDVNPYLVDAIIGLSVCYKALENLRVFNAQRGPFIKPELAVFGFGLIHGFGLSSKLQELKLNPDGLIINMLSFNLGVEIGQIMALIFLLGIFFGLRSLRQFGRIAIGANMTLFVIGLVLFGLQITGFFVGMN